VENGGTADRQDGRDWAPDPAFEVPLTRAYHRHTPDFCGEFPNRLKGVTQIAHRLGVSPATLYRYLPAARIANTPGV